MRTAAPAELVALLEELGLAERPAFAAVRGRVRRFPRELAAFDAPWIDALQRAGTLTPWQAAELHAGRGRTLALGPFHLLAPLPCAYWARVYCARHRDSHRAVRLVVCPCPESARDELLAKFSRQIASAALVEDPRLTLPYEAGWEHGQVWIAQPLGTGEPAALRVAHRGRFGPPVVHELARQMTAALAELARHDLVHGDLSAFTLLLESESDSITLCDGLIRPVARPYEGFDRLDVPAEALDYLAPQRATDAAPCSPSTDLYACGLLWWHLLAGRPPLAAGSSLGKLQAAAVPRVPDIRRIAPDTPRPLSEAIRACLQPRPERRPGSFAELGALLGGTSAPARRRATASRPSPAHRRSRVSSYAAPLLATAAAVLVLAATATVAWPRIARHARSHAATQAVTPFAAPPTAAGPTKPSAVQPASHHPDPDTIRIDGTVVRLPGNQRIGLERLKLRTGQTVRPPDGQRTTLVVGPNGLAIDGDRLQFEDIDFVHRRSGGQASAAALLRLRAGTATFVHCTFDGTASSTALSPAINWQIAATPGDELSTARLELRDCVLRHLRTGVDVAHGQATSLRLLNCLILGPGAVVRLGQAPSADAPVRIALEQATVRDAAGLIEMHARVQASSVGSLVIDASDSVFAPPAGSALLTFQDPPDEGWLQSIAWRGQGSVVLPGVMFAAGLDRTGVLRPVAEEGLSVAGLVRGAVEFAGPAKSNPAASEIVRWQVPLIADHPPGIDAQRLHDTTGPVTMAERP
ncbi:MAG: protein kinase [Pirellulales bacterium]|nr:protein kinase [Pirellulales bacterium]